MLTASALLPNVLLQTGCNNPPEPWPESPLSAAYIGKTCTFAAFPQLTLQARVPRSRWLLYLHHPRVRRPAHHSLTPYVLPPASVLELTIKARPVFRFFYNGSKNLFNGLSSHQGRQARSKKKSIVTSIANAHDFVDLCNLFGYYAGTTPTIFFLFPTQVEPGRVQSTYHVKHKSLPRSCL